MFLCVLFLLENITHILFSSRAVEGSCGMICVECGLRLESESLYVEYSERNIKLMRCVRCVNDDLHVFVIYLNLNLSSVSFSCRTNV